MKPCRAGRMRRTWAPPIIFVIRGAEMASFG
jgi:hypothetical protein